MPHSANAFEFVGVYVHVYVHIGACGGQGWIAVPSRGCFSFLMKQDLLLNRKLTSGAILAGHQTPRFLLCPPSLQAGVTGTHCHNGLFM